MEQPSDQKNTVKPPFYQRKEFPPLAIFGAFLLILFLATAFSGRPPSIDRISQEDNLSAEIVTIAGRNFGAPGTGGEVHIGDLALTQSNYLKWSEEEIVVSIPREVSSGIISVVTKDGRCRGDIYMNPDEIPRRTSYRGPLVGGLSAENLTPGRLLVIRGDRFGSDRGTGRVSFSQIIPQDGRRDRMTLAEQLVNASAADLDYVSWSKTEIAVRVPDGAKTGLVMVATDQGQSNYKYITVIPQPGKKSLDKRTTYRLRLGVFVSVSDATLPNALTVFLPAPVSAPEQRNITVASGAASVVSADSFPGVIRTPDGELRYARRNLVPGTLDRVTVEYTLDRFEVNTIIDASLAVGTYDREGEFYRVFTAEDPFISYTHPAVAAFARGLALAGLNPYQAARAVYDFIRERLTPEGAAGAAPDADWCRLVPEQRGDAWLYTALFTALARKAGLPARPVAGLVIDRSGTVHPHYWSEFYLPDFGWVPVDPWLGEGVTYRGAPLPDDPAAYYFGNLDNRHITLARGYSTPAPADAQSRLAAGSGPLSLRSFDQEASGGLKRYSVTWEPLSAGRVE